MTPFDIIDELLRQIHAFDVEHKANIKRSELGFSIMYEGIKSLDDIPYAYDTNGNDIGYDGPYGWVQYTTDPYFNWFWQKLQFTIENWIALHPNTIEYDLDWRGDVSMVVDVIIK